MYFMCVWIDFNRIFEGGNKIPDKGPVNCGRVLVVFGLKRVSKNTNAGN